MREQEPCEGAVCGRGRPLIALLILAASACGGGAASAPPPKSKPPSAEPGAASEQPAARAAPASADGQPLATESATVPAGTAVDTVTYASQGTAAPAGGASNATGATLAAPPRAAAAPAGSAPAAAGAPVIVEGADIPRAALLAVLSGGVGRFLQRVQVEPATDRGRFVGWRVVRVFDDAQLGKGGVHAGDTLLRVNGQSIERPEQFKNVWDSLATESQLILQVERAGQKSEIRHRIVQ